MPLETQSWPQTAHLEKLNFQHRSKDAVEILRAALLDRQFGKLALVSSFGAEAVVLLHMVSRIDRNLPILFIDTELLFDETLAYQRQVSALLELGDVRIVRADRESVFSRDPDNLLHHFEPDACCALRKTEPLTRALEGFDGWITGRKRYQSGTRQSLDVFEFDAANRIKVNPLAHWKPEDVADYFARNRLPRHPLIKRGYPSIGCAPCTSPVENGEHARAGRWRNNEKLECGIHFNINQLDQMKGGAV